ncbi:hypothetical protein [Actinoplanes sp. OR16]|uniref:hypothetical protein n=1 Tax=Actinoplanes sp. OR16 TaxID=946334 RepID=UPI00135F18E1|nr:hypothetical protein [Actinoplanes sp. OR16]
MKRFLPVAVCLFALAACGDSSSPAAAPTAAASTAAAAPSAASAASAASVVEDKALCKALNTAAKDLRTGITEAQQDGGGVKAADAKRTFTKFHTTVTEALAFAPASEVTTAAKAIADELGDAAKAADPIGTAADSNFTQLGEDLTTACKSAGVEIMF